MFKGKAGSLKFLQGLGLKVPEWKLIKHADIVSWGKPNLWKDLQHALRPGNTADIAFKLDHFFQSIAVPKDLLAAFRGHGHFAVRSSASVEDSPDNSFAGIFETKLFVQGSLDWAIKDVWASLYSSSALRYCDERGISYSRLGMDVIVQKMVLGEKSGVLFQADPMGNIGHQIIVAGWGLGQGIVDDITDTDRYIIEGAEIIESEIAHKNTFLAWDEYSNQLVEKHVHAAQSRISVLNEKDIDQLLAASEKVSTLNDHYMDIEFTFQGKDLYVLQARPITTVPTKKHLLIFDNSNIAENYPHQSLPLTYSLLRRGYAANFKNLITFLGFPKEERKAIEGNLEQLTGYWGGQIYYNLNNWYSVYGLLPYGGKKAIKSFNDMVGIKTASPVKHPERGHWQNFRLMMTVLPKFAGYYLNTKKHHEKYKVDFKELYHHLKLKSQEGKGTLEILDLIQQLDSSYLDIIKIPLFNDFFSSVLNHACRDLARKMAGPHGEKLYNDLLSHREDLESSRAIYSLIDLAQQVSHKKDLMRFLDTHKSFPDVMKRIKDFDLDFYHSLARHFDRFGDRSQWEMKVEVPTARENPETTLKLILNYARSGLSQEEQRKHEREKAGRARSMLTRHAATHPLKGFIFWVLYRKCTEALCFREDSRFDRVRIKGLSRSLILKLGELMVKKGLLSSPEDLFYLTFEEIMALRHDSFGSGYLKELVELRRKHLNKLLDLSLPDRIIVNDLSSVERFDKEPSSQMQTELFGIPCSGGYIEAECVVVHDLNTAPDLSGKILIAKRTDPAWGYFFVGVKGIIIEKGSMLSHAAIISRELGIPCIINVANATTIFSTGKRLQMNGDTGEIKIM